MSESKFKKWMKDEYQRYCSISTMHGYTELYSAKTLLFKCVWFAIIIASIAITGYQVNQSVYQYMCQSSFTNIALATNDDVIYPPLKICLPHWIMWVDYRKMDTYFSKNATLYSLSYLTNIYSIDEFDIEAARKEFLTGFAKSNFTDLFDYYAHLAVSPSTWISFGPYRAWILTSQTENIYNNYINTMFHVDWANTQSEYPVLCYTADGSSIKKHLTEGYKNVFIETTEKNNVHFYLNSLSEMNMYYRFKIWDKLSKNTTKKYLDEWQNETSYPTPKPSTYAPYNKPPYAVLVDGYTDDFTFVSAEQETVTFTVKTSANIWLSTTANPCVSEKFIVSNKTCQQSCSKKYYVEKAGEITFEHFKNNCSLLLQSFYVKNYKDDLAKLCRHLFYFGIKWTRAKIDDAPIHKDISSAPERIGPLNVRSNLSQPLLAECISNCTVYCENWKYEISKSYSSGTVFIQTLKPAVAYEIYPQVIIEYPTAGQILILTEMDSQTWENFVSNIGGLLGIWTGASILSFIQLFYLCCCAAIDEAYTPKWFRLKKIHIAKTSQQQIHPPKILQPSRFQYIP